MGPGWASSLSMYLPIPKERNSFGNTSDHPHVWRRYRLLLLGSDRVKTPSLRDPRRRISVGREAVCFLHEFAKACDPDFVSVPVLEYLVYCVVHRRGPFWLGREGQG